MSLVQPAEKTGSKAGRRVNRRTVLAGALTAGAGVAAIRLWGESAQRSLQQVQQGSRSDWISPLAGEGARISHLLRRTSLGATPAELEQTLSDGLDRTIDRLLETKPAQPPPFEQIGARLNLSQLQLWWVQQMLSTATPFAERLTLFWHGHFTSDFRKVGLQTPFIYWQNLTWRDMALGNFRDMLMRVTSDPAMLRYLDLATSTGANPNENYSRELMELFTMGAGNFTEDDVRAGAKALAGWTEPRPPFTSPVPGVFNQRRAYGGAVTLLGKTARFDTEAVVDRIVAQNATATFIVNKVLAHFATPRPDAGYVKRLADGFRRSNYDLKTLFRDVFKSPEFSADSSYRSLVKNPTEFMVGAAKALQAPQLARLIVASGPGMGQMLFDPPDVGGWPNNDIWIDSNNVIARVNFATAALNQLKTPPPARDAHQRQLEGVLSPATAQLLNQAGDDTARWFLVLASPEFQLK